MDGKNRPRSEFKSDQSFKAWNTKYAGTAAGSIHSLGYTLRECTHAENHQNRGLAENNVSGLTGVGWHKLRGKWRADIKVNGKQRALGLFETIEQAHQAYLSAKQIDHTFQPVPRSK